MYFQFNNGKQKCKDTNSDFVINKRFSFQYFLIIPFSLPYSAGFLYVRPLKQRVVGNGINVRLSHCTGEIKVDIPFSLP
jgi:hypothetical protein